MISEVFLEDCMVGLKRYADEFFDLAIVDVPYGIGMDNSNKRTKPSRPNSYTNYKPLRYHETNWDDAAPDENYFRELFRVSKNQLIFGANYFNHLLPSGHGWIFWNKLNGLDNCFSDGEFIFASFGIQSRYFECSPFDNLRGGKDRIHPTQKPVRLYKWLLENYGVCKECHGEGGYYEDVVGDGGSRMYMACESCDGSPKILDTHVGSGSSRIAAYDMNFDFVGFEIDATYHAAQEQRFSLYKSQPKLPFTKQEIISEQEKLF